MLIRELKLTDVKSYEEGHFRFEEGVNGICGLNGHGKTTVVEAIGFALYNHLPYKKTEFTRQGKKNGTVEVRLECDDGVEVLVRRRVTDGAPEVRLPHRTLKGDDARHWLEENLLDRGTPYSEAAGLFQDMIGVPQGTFTSIFHETTAVRKTKFDRLLRVEDYRKCITRLKEPQNSVKAGLEERERSAVRLRALLESLPGLKKDLVDREKESGRMEKELRGAEKELGGVEKQYSAMKDIRERMTALEKELSGRQGRTGELRTRLERAKKESAALMEAEKQLEDTRDAFGAYEGLKKERELLEKEQKKAAARSRELASVVGEHKADMKRADELEKDVRRIEEMGGELPGLKEQNNRLEAVRAESADLRARADRLRKEVGDLIKSKDGVGAKNTCPVFNGVTCTTVEDFSSYFKKEIGKRNVDIKEADRALAVLGKEEKGLAKVPASLQRLMTDIERRKELDLELKAFGKKRTRTEKSLAALEKDGGEDVLRSLEERRKGLKDRERDSEKGHRAHLEAGTLRAKLKGAPAEAKRLQKELKELEKALEKGEKELGKLSGNFDADAFTKTEAELTELRVRISGGRAAHGQVVRQAGDIGARLKELDGRARELERVEKEAEADRGLLSYIAFVRDTLKGTAEAVTHAFVEEISVLAAQTYSELMEDGAQVLRWEPGYGLCVVDRGSERDFRQLSGGEQMGAAIALRLALLRGLGGSDVIFLDEPTQNMDERRRALLSRQIHNIKGFRQIFVITHDDAFGSDYHNVIRVEKREGVSRVLANGEGLSTDAGTDITEES